MADVIETFTSRKGRPPKYPWTESDAKALGLDFWWMDDKARRLYRGEDFDSGLTSMRTMIHRKARDQGLNALTHINEADESIEVRFYSKD